MKEIQGIVDEVSSRNEIWAAASSKPGEDWRAAADALPELGELPDIEIPSILEDVGDMTAETEGASMAKWDRVSTWWVADRSEGASDQG